MKKFAEVELLCFSQTPKAYHVGLALEDRENNNSFFLPIKSVTCEVNKVVKGVVYCTFKIPEWIINRQQQLSFLREELEEMDDSFDILEED